jgi:hypothetical protein
MSDDLLERATKALRAEGGAEPAPDRAAQLRARVLSQTKRRAQLRPQGLYQWAAVICLGFFATTAMANVIRVQLPKVLEMLRQEPAAPAPAAPKSNPKKPAHPKVAPVVAPDAGSGTVEPSVEPAAPQEQLAPAVAPPANAPATPLAPAPSLAPAPRSGKPRVATRRAPKRSVAPAPGAAVQEHDEREAAHAALPELEPEPVAQPSAAPAQPAATPPKTTAESAELALFRRAQTLHLAHDKRAIEAWDAFLRVAQASALAPEARYNRALGLLRATRYSEAKDALAPFADGKYGSYRKQEAKDLLARMPK